MRQSARVCAGARPFYARPSRRSVCRELAVPRSVGIGSHRRRFALVNRRSTAGSWGLIYGIDMDLRISRIDEAIGWREGDTKRFDGKGVRKAVKHVNTEIGQALKGIDASDQRGIDLT